MVGVRHGNWGSSKFIWFKYKYLATTVFTLYFKFIQCKFSYLHWHTSFTKSFLTIKTIPSQYRQFFLIYWKTSLQDRNSKTRHQIIKKETSQLKLHRSTKMYDKQDDINCINHKFSKYVRQYTSFPCTYCLHLTIDSLCKDQ